MADSTSVIVAAIGVAGTLTAPALANAALRRAKREELRAERDREADRRAEEEVRELRAEKKRCYIRHNMAAREYMGALEEWSFAQENGAVTPPDNFLARRSEYRASYAEAQMIVADDVLRAAGEVNDALGGAFAMLRRLEGDGARSSDSPAQARSRARSGLSPLRKMRDLMRADLGTAQPLPRSTEATARAHDE